MLKISIRGVLAHKFRLLLTLVAVIVSVSFMSGTQILTATIATSFDKVFDDVYKNLDAVVRSTDKVKGNFGTFRSPVSADVLPKVEAVPGVEAAEGQVQGSATIIDKAGDPMGSAQTGPPSFGMNWLTRPQLNGWVLAEGRPPAGPAEVVLDRKSATKADYRVGEAVRVETNKGVREFTLTGVAGFGKTLDYAGSPAALFDTATAQDLLGEAGKYTWISVAGDPALSQSDLTTRIHTALTNDEEAITGAAFTQESQDVFRQFFEVLGYILLAFGLVSAFVGSFIIYNTFSIIVAQRTRELALLRAMGASRLQVWGSVGFEAMIVGVLSAVLGLLAGVGLSRALTAALSASNAGVAIEGLTLPPMAFVSSFVIGVVITLVSALVPAVRASRVPPVAAMRDVSVDTSGSSRGRLWTGAAVTVVGALLMYLGLFVGGDYKLPKTGGGIFAVMLGAIILGPLFARPMSHVIGAPLWFLNGRLARANAMRNPRRTAATASALMIGVALIVMFSVVIQSLKASVSTSIASSFTADVVVDSQTFGMTGLALPLADEVAAVPGVGEVIGIEAGIVTIGGRPSSVLGADLTKLPHVIPITSVEGDIGQLRDNEIAVSKSVAAEKGVQLGTDFPMTVLQGGERTFKVGAIYDVRNVGNLGYLMSMQGYAANFPVQQQTYNQIYLKVAPGAKAAEVRDRVKPVVKARFATAVVQDLSEYANAQSAQFDIMLFIVNVLLLLAIVVAGLGIVNTLLLSVYERTREIGLLRAVGMSRGQVRAVVGWESVIFSLQGAAIGLGIGLVFAGALVTAFGQQTSFITLTVPWGLLAALPLLALGAGIAAAVVPAFSASRMRILDAIATD